MHISCVIPCDLVLGALNGFKLDASVAYFQKILKFRIFSCFEYPFPSSGIRAYYHMIYMLKMLIITSVMIIYIDICKCCEYGD